MTPKDFMRHRLADLEGKEFINPDVLVPSHEYGFTSGELENALKSLKADGDIIRTGKQSVYVLFRFIGNRPNSKSKNVSPWSKVWPEFFTAPSIYGKCRTFNLSID
ncbi:MAG TPA: hypothetical protein VFM18_10415 [Methanosarcina sp.]|nr:hypothetical protein [Methanosarcina sp.]